MIDSKYAQIKASKVNVTMPLDALDGMPCWLKPGPARD
jgi:hypothetical protein